MGTLLQDLRYAWRGLRKDPGFSLLAVLALSLGIGAVTTIFSVIQNVLLDPFPYAGAQRLVTIQIHDTTQSGRGGRSGFTTPEFLDYVAANHVFDRVIGSTQRDMLYRRAGGGTEQFDGAETTPNSFEALGVPPLLGRGIGSEDGKPGAPPVFVMSYKMWNKSFNFDPKILDSTFILNGTPRRLVGIMPPRFTWFGADLWVPATLNRGDPAAKTQFFFLVGHLKPGVTFAQATADLEVVARHLAVVYPEQYPKKFQVQVQSLAESVVGGFRDTLYILMAAVGMLLLIACGNVANMLLARATAREKEIAVRASLGASRWRLIRQFLIESALLASGGAVLGCVIAYGGMRLLVPRIPPHTVPDEAVIHLNPMVLLFTLAVSVATVLLFGLAPAVHASRQHLAEALKDTGKGVNGGFRHGKLRAALVVAEVTLSLVLLTGAGLLMRSFFALEQTNLGFDPKNILVARLPLPAGQYKTVEQKRRFFSELLRRLYATPGVIAATETSTLPPYGGIGTEVEIPGKVHTEKWNAIVQIVSEHYFGTLGLRISRGRLLNEIDVNSSRKVAVVNQALVRGFFPGQDPIGRSIQLNILKTLPEPVTDPVFEIVGVVSDAKNRGIQESPMPELFLPYTVTAFGERGILVRTAGDPLRLLDAVRRQIWAVDSNVALTLTGSLEGYLRQFSYAGPQFGLVLLSVFASVGLVLVSIGIYSVISYTVSRQTHEIGIRMALGAGAHNVLGMVLKMGLRLIALGVVLGLAASLAGSRLLASQLFGISPYDPFTIVSVVTLLVGIGLAACYFPARRAMRVDPMIALRYE